MDNAKKNLVDALEAAKFAKRRDVSGGIRFERGQVRVCLTEDDGTNIYVFSDKIGYTLSYEMHFSSDTPAAIVAAAAKAAVES